MEKLLIIFLKKYFKDNDIDIAELYFLYFIDPFNPYLRANVYNIAKKRKEDMDKIEYDLEHTNMENLINEFFNFLKAYDFADFTYSKLLDLNLKIWEIEEFLIYYYILHYFLKKGVKINRYSHYSKGSGDSLWAVAGEDYGEFSSVSYSIYESLTTDWNLNYIVEGLLEEDRRQYLHNHISPEEVPLQQIQEVAKKVRENFILAKQKAKEEIKKIISG